MNEADAATDAGRPTLSEERIGRTFRERDRGRSPRFGKGMKTGLQSGSFAVRTAIPGVLGKVERAVISTEVAP
jgi:hypothetical protein